MKRQTSLLKSALTILLLGLSAGCGTAGPGTRVSGGNPATPPAPPAELPSALRFPSDLGINVDKVASQPSPGALEALVGPGGQYSDIISAAPNLVQTFNQFVKTLLQPVSQSDIPVSTTTTFEFTALLGTLNVDVKLDFADFDLDGDGHTEACAGHTAGLPICYRIWLNGQQFMAGLFTKFPTAGNNGAGFFRAIGHSPAQGSGGAHDVYTGVVYDHEDPMAKSTEFFQRGVLSGDPVDQRDPKIPDQHSIVSQDGPDATAKKRLGFSSSEVETSPGVTEPPGQFLEQWREDQDFWSGSFFQEGEPFNFTDVCAVISTGNAADVVNCQDLGIDVAGIPFIDFLTSDDVSFPADFPVSPTF